MILTKNKIVGIAFRLVSGDLKAESYAHMPSMTMMTDVMQFAEYVERITSFEVRFEYSKYIEGDGLIAFGSDAYEFEYVLSQNTDDNWICNSWKFFDPISWLVWSNQLPATKYGYVNRKYWPVCHFTKLPVYLSWFGAGEVMLSEIDRVKNALEYMKHTKGY